MINKILCEINADLEESGRSFFDILLFQFRLFLFRIASPSAVPLFLRPHDIISTGPICEGAHEPHVAHAIKSLSKAGYDDFFLDIGANIGLTAYQCAHYFKVAHLFEPNPLACHVLRANVESTPATQHCKIHNYGLGKIRQTVELVVPERNWGGAYACSPENMYSGELLDSKDAHSIFKDTSASSVRTVIRIEPTSDVLKGLFPDFVNASKSTCNGVIKIDVEGMELTIINEIEKSLPKSVKVAILFEFLDRSIDLNIFLKQSLNRDFQLFELRRFPNTGSARSSFFKKIVGFLRHGVRYQVTPAHSISDSSDYLLFLE